MANLLKSEDAKLPVYGLSPRIAGLPVKSRLRSAADPVQGSVSRYFSYQWKSVPRRTGFVVFAASLPAWKQRHQMMNNTLNQVRKQFLAWAWLPTTGLCIVLASTPVISSAAVAGKSTFPRLGGYQIGATPFQGYGDPEYQKQMARLDYVIIGQTQLEANDVARAIKNISPNIILAKYTNIIDIPKAQQNFFRT